jgi:hypothetical protein
MSDNMSTVPPVIAAPPPPLTGSTRPAGSWRKIISILLSLCLGLFLADAFVSLADDSWSLFSGFHPLTGLRLVTSLFAFLLALLVYCLMAFTPMISKRVFLPLTWFGIVTQLALLPGMIYCYDRLPWLIWGISLAQVVLGLGILGWARGGVHFRWPLVPEDRLGAKSFSWWNLISFPLVNVLVLLPVVVVYLFFCAALAVGHFTDGFLALQPAGLTATVKKFTRADGKMIQLVPMAHVGDPAFYQKLTKSFPTNALILMEGVTDENNLLTNGISYQRMASALGLSEQKKEFKPERNQIVRADVDVDTFTPGTIAMLNVVMRIHAQGLTPAALRELLQFPATPEMQSQLFEDLVTKRNQHLVEEIRTHLAGSDLLIVPWGAAHMPGIAQAIQKSGFELVETQQFTVIHFGGAKKPGPAGRSKP